ncbi:hypothetical protein SSX86_023834 [Deinandra increscens subsp. villosa]|uniref:Uncharacterized protein n=1 Tax=Deinandra increscens subsp. villosa TaxID=3103831 RepID=A0AAP0GN69_9ASTR
MEDAFTSRRRHFNNEPFGFIRFKDVKDVERMERQLNSLAIHGHVMLANLSQVPRGPPPGVLRQRIEARRIPTVRPSVVEYDAHLGGRFKSFNDVVVGVNARDAPQHSEAAKIFLKWKSFNIPDDGATYPSSFFGRALFGEAKDGSSLCSIKFLHHEGGGGVDFDVVYVGGLHVLMVFN